MPHPGTALRPFRYRHRHRHRVQHHLPSVQRQASPNFRIHTFRTRPAAPRPQRTATPPPRSTMATAFLPCAPHPLPRPRTSAAHLAAATRAKPVGTPRLLRPPTRRAPHPPRMSLSPDSSTANKILQGPLDGRYGTWYFRQSDADDVLTYRVALAAMAASSCASFTLALMRFEQPVLYDSLYFFTLACFGVALNKIHIYMKPMHDLLKALWAMGVVGSVLACVLGWSGGEEGVVHALLSQPLWLLAGGWWFVALTGLFVKEAVCFGRVEAVALGLLVPGLSGGHFVGMLSRGTEVVGGAVFCAVFVLFAVRKLRQDAIDDVGDLSVFEHLASGGEL